MIKVIIRNNWLFKKVLKGYSGITLWPFVIVKKNASEKMLRHEAEHMRQQVRGLLVGFYLRYGAEYLWGRIKGNGHGQAYRDISYERAARKASGQ